MFDQPIGAAAGWSLSGPPGSGLSCPMSAKGSASRGMPWPRCGAGT